MEVFLTCTDLGLPTVVFTASVKSLVEEALREATSEWDVNDQEFELWFGEQHLPLSSLLLSHGVRRDDELVVLKKQFRIFDKSYFINNIKREDMIKNILLDGVSHLDASTFAIDGCLSLDLPSEVEKVIFHDHYLSIKTISEMFLNHSSVASIDLSRLSSIKFIDGEFANNCESLSELCTSGFQNVVSIGSEFLYACSSLLVFDMSNLCSLTSIGSGFLDVCVSLKSLDLSYCHSLTTISDGFLYECVSLSELNLSGLTKVTHIGSFFCNCCAALLEIDLSSFSELSEIGESFLMNTPARVVLTGLKDSRKSLIKDLLSTDLTDFTE